MLCCPHPWMHWDNSFMTPCYATWRHAHKLLLHCHVLPGIFPTRNYRLSLVSCTCKGLRIITTPLWGCCGRKSMHVQLWNNDVKESFLWNKQMHLVRFPLHSHCRIKEDKFITMFYVLNRLLNTARRAFNLLSHSHLTNNYSQLKPDGGWSNIYPRNSHLTNNYSQLFPRQMEVHPIHTQETRQIQHQVLDPKWSTEQVLLEYHSLLGEVLDYSWLPCCTCCDEAYATAPRLQRDHGQLFHK